MTFRFDFTEKCLQAYATSATVLGILLAIVKMVVVEVVVVVAAAAVAAAVASNYNIHIQYFSVKANYKFQLVRLVNN